jgi:hypothetical protein
VRVLLRCSQGRSLPVFSSLNGIRMNYANLRK